MTIVYWLCSRVYPALRAIMEKLPALTTKRDMADQISRTAPSLKGDRNALREDSRTVNVHNHSPGHDIRNWGQGGPPGRDTDQVAILFAAIQSGTTRSRVFSRWLCQWIGTKCHYYMIANGGRFALRLLGVGTVLVGVLVVESSAIALTPFTKRYILLLAAPPLASYTGTLPNLPATHPQTIKITNPTRYTGVHVDLNSADSQSYLRHLREQQDDFLGKLRAAFPEVSEPLWRYSIAANGIALRLPFAAAQYASKMPEVRAIQPEEALYEELDGSISAIGAPAVWPLGPVGAGEGRDARIAIVEAAHAVDHPFFADSAMPSSPEGYPLVEYTEAGQESRRLEDPNKLTNKKFIGVRLFADELDAEGIAAFREGKRLTNHGTHLAGIAAGTTGAYQILPGVHAQLSGVAPHAHVLSYPLSGGTPELLAALEAAAGKDRIDSLILSMGTHSWLPDDPLKDVIALAMRGASDAGVAVVTSAGNPYERQGPMVLTGAWKHSPHVITVAASSVDGGTGIPMTLSSDSLPATGKEVLLHPIGRAESSLATNLIATIGDGCKAEPGLVGAIAVVPMYERVGDVMVSCGEGIRSRAMAASGAVGLITVSDLQAYGVIDQPDYPVEIPTYRLQFPHGLWLRNALLGGQVVHAEISPHFVRRWYPQTEYLIHKSARGPAFNGDVKPDLSAPGLNIISSVVDPSQLPYAPIDPSLLFQPLSGTSAAAAHVAGAVALLRSLHPDWSVPTLRSALMNTSWGGVQILNDGVLSPAKSIDTGAGRLDVSRAVDPGLIISPPSLGLGHVSNSDPSTRSVVVSSIDPKATCWRVLAKTDHPATVKMRPERFLLWPNKTLEITISVATDTTPRGLLDGALILEELAIPNLPIHESLYLPTLFGIDSSQSSPGQSHGMVHESDGLRRAPDRPQRTWAAPISGWAWPGSGGPSRDPGPSPHYRAHADALNTEGRNERRSYTNSIAEQPCLGIETPTGRTLRVPFVGSTALPHEVHRNVLLVHHPLGGASTQLDYYTNALNEAGLSFTVWNMTESTKSEDVGRFEFDHPPLTAMRQHDMVLIDTAESTVTMQQWWSFFGGYHGYLLGGGNLLIAGQGPANGWRYLDWAGLGGSGRAPKERYPETSPHRWGGPHPDAGCELCIVRYFAGYTPHLTATLSGKLLLPYGTRPSRPQRSVILQPHPAAEAANPLSRYRLDISTLRLAKDGAAGNQFAFASGDVLREYKPSLPDDPATPVDESQVWQNLGDVDERPWLRARDAAGRILPDFARPLWSFQVGQETKVVGTYIAGKQHPEADIPWNAMFWGFGLEGVGEAGPGSASRARLIADAFNFLAKNLQPQATLQAGPDGRRSLAIDLGPHATPLVFERAEVRYGAQGTDPVSLVPPASSAPAVALPLPAASSSSSALAPALAPAPPAPSTRLHLPLRPPCPSSGGGEACFSYASLQPGDLTVVLYPKAGTAAKVEIEVQERAP